MKQMILALVAGLSFSVYAGDFAQLKCRYNSFTLKEDGSIVEVPGQEIPLAGISYTDWYEVEDYEKGDKLVIIRAYGFSDAVEVYSQDNPNYYVSMGGKLLVETDKDYKVRKATSIFVDYYPATDKIESNKYPEKECIFVKL